MDKNNMTFDPVTLLELKLLTRTWPNKCQRHNLPLVSPALLEGIEEAIEAARTIIDSITFPIPWREGRFCHMTDLHLRIPGLLSDPQHMLYLAVTELQRHWPDVLVEAKSRLGKLFSENDFPQADELPSLYDLGLELIPENSVRTREILGKYSKFYEKPEEFTMYDAIEWCRKIEAKRQKTESGRDLESGVQEKDFRVLEQDPEKKELDN